MEDDERSRFGLLPTEELLWRGAPEVGVPRDLRYRLVPFLLLAFGAVAWLFAALLHVAEIGAARPSALVGAYLWITAIAALIAPRYLLDPCEFALTDRRVIWRRGRVRRSMDRAAITFARIRWHRSVPRVGHLELVRAVPFGPLARKQRLLFHDLREPDVVLSLIRGVEAGPRHGDGEVPLLDRLDPGEQVLWGSGPKGLMIGWREALTALLGAGCLAIGLRYAVRTAGILRDLEGIGLPVGSLTWILFLLAALLSGGIVVGVGVGLLWWGLVRPRQLGLETDYVLTDQRLLIRRGRTELSLDRQRIVDAAESSGWLGVRHLHLILDAPEARALATSGAMKTVGPSRDLVPPILYGLHDRDTERVRNILLKTRPRRPSVPPLLDAA